MARLGQDFADGADLNQAAGVHDRKAMDELRHQSDIVADQQQGGVALLLLAAERLHHQPLRHHIERAGRFIGDDDFGSEQHANGDADALLHAAGKFMRITPKHLRTQSDTRKCRNAEPAHFTAAR